jgi:hypothetical protein
MAWTAMGGWHNDVPCINSAEMAEEFSEEPDIVVLHYFVNSDPANLEVMEHVRGLDPCIDEPSSITNFFILPAVTKQQHTKFKDPIIYSTQSKILTSDEYSVAAEEQDCLAFERSSDADVDVSDVRGPHERPPNSMPLYPAVGTADGHSNC